MVAQSTLTPKGFKMKEMVNIIGLGYIGLPTALMIAAHGISVVGTAHSSEKVDQLLAGKVTFKENGLPELFEVAIKKDIRFTTEYVQSNIYIVAVPTPYNKIAHEIDASFVVDAVSSVLDVCPNGAIIVIESTISPGTVEKYVYPVARGKGKEPGKDVFFAHAPERIIPGNMIYELEHNSRTIGAETLEVAEKVKKIYASFCQGEIILTDIKTAEMTKVVENTFRDINIAFANELAKICREGDMDVYEIIRIANKHPRVNILNPGPGVGGHCISVDPWFLVGDFPETAKLINQARQINDSMPMFVLSRAKEIMHENGLTDISRVGLYGLTYKEDVDDVRESPTLQMLEQMKEEALPALPVYDPMVQKNLVENQYHDLDEFLNAVDLVVVMVGHSQLRQNSGLLKNKLVLDTRHVMEEHVYHI